MGVEQAAAKLVERAKQLHDLPPDIIFFTPNEAANRLACDLEQHPHFYVFGCLMDFQMSSERAWEIPYRVAQAFGGTAFETFARLSQEELEAFFVANSLHRFPKRAARFLYRAAQHIHQTYQGNAANIWKDNPTSATVVQRFSEFSGMGLKIASMATNILARDFRVPMSDRTSIDVSPDVHLKRVMGRMGLVADPEDLTAIINAARVINPDYPGLLDFSLWEIGRTWCRPTHPACGVCYLGDVCPKVGVEGRDDLTTNRADLSQSLQLAYDRAADVLYLSVGDPRPSITRPIGDDVLLRIDAETGQVVGLTVLNLSTRADLEALPISVYFQETE